jgi:hypothetical protein
MTPAIDIRVLQRFSIGFIPMTHVEKLYRDIHFERISVLVSDFNVRDTQSISTGNILSCLGENGVTTTTLKGL